jgi:hypothetical protein
MSWVPGRPAEKVEVNAVSQQVQITADISSQIRAIPQGLDAVVFSELRSRMSDLKKKADSAASRNDLNSLVARRTRQQLVAEAFESGQGSADLKKHDEALQYFEIAAAGVWHPECSQYQRARVCALKGDKKGVIAALNLAVAAGFNDTSALEENEFQHYRQLPEFQGLVTEIKAKAKP